MVKERETEKLAQLAQNSVLLDQCLAAVMQSR